MPQPTKPRGVKREEKKTHTHTLKVERTEKDRKKG